MRLLQHRSIVLDELTGCLNPEGVEHMYPCGNWWECVAARIAQLKVNVLRAVGVGGELGSVLLGCRDQVWGKIKALIVLKPTFSA